jgi:hypothetical protein
VDAAVAVLEAESISHFVALKAQDESVAESLVHKGWERAGFGPNAAILSTIADVNGITFWPIGAFDDKECGCGALTKPEVLNELLR